MRLCSLSFWTVVVHTFTAFKRSNASHGAPFPHKTACFSLSEGQLNVSFITLISDRMKPASQQFTPHIETRIKAYPERKAERIAAAGLCNAGFLRENCTHVASFEEENRAFKQSQKIPLQRPKGFSGQRLHLCFSQHRKLSVQWRRESVLTPSWT